MSKHARIALLAVATIMVGVGVAPAAPASSTVPSATALAPASVFTETFSGLPATPQQWKPSNWDVVVHSREVATYDSLLPMAAHHGPDCAGPPATHPISSYEDSVFLCKDHMMTSINADGYGVIYLTPDHQLDFSQGEGIVSWDMSTLRTSIRDWVDVWITPFSDNLELPLEQGYPDLSGPPRRAVHVVMDQVNRKTWFRVEIYDNFQNIETHGDATKVWEDYLVPDAARRDRFELHLSTNHVKFGMPNYNLWWIDDDIAPLSWNTGVVTLGHHSYNPTKDCVDPEPCLPDTWHWDNVTISPAIPFTLLRDNIAAVGGGGPQTVSFPQPAPANGFLRFAGIGDNLQVSYDGGASWVPAVKRETIVATATEHFASFWMPVPAGTQQVAFRGDNWWGGPWVVRDITIWSDNGVSVAPPVGGGGGGSGGDSSEIVGLNPARLLDTRAGSPTVDDQFAGGGVTNADGVLQLPVTNRGGVPASAAAAVLNVTATGATGTGYLTIYPCGAARPLASNINYAPGRDVANAVIAKVGTGGTVCIYTGVAGTHIIADVNGYFPAASSYTALNPARLLDTRAGSPTVDDQFAGGGVTNADGVLQLPVTNRGGVPASAAAAVLNVTATGATGTGYLTIYPCGAARPLASNINYAPGRDVANAVIAKVGTGGTVCIYTGVAGTHIIADVNGYFPAASSYTALNPARLLDTRAGSPTVDDQFAGGGVTNADGVLQLPVTNRGGVPASAAAAVLNVTATGATGTGYLTIYPCGAARPLASNINYAPGRDVANAVIAKVGTGGTVCIYTGVAGTHIIADVNGYFPVTGASVQSFPSSFTSTFTTGPAASALLATKRSSMPFFCELGMTTASRPTTD